MDSMFDITKARQETTACNSIIHFNNAGASLMPTPVSKALHEYLDQEEQRGGPAGSRASLGDIGRWVRRLLRAAPLVGDSGGGRQ